MSTRKSATKKAAAMPDAIQVFERALTLLYAKKWSSAETAFASIVEDDGSSIMAERSRRYIEVCQRKTNPAKDDGDTYLNAVFAKNAGDLEASMELCNRGGLKGRDERFTYLAAAIEDLSENHEEAARLLKKAIEMNRANRVHAYHDPDFEGLRNDPKLAEILSID